MDTSLATAAAPPRAPLTYPFEAPPARGETLEVAPGVLWIRMPLPFKLDHINLWALANDSNTALKLGQQMTGAGRPGTFAAGRSGHSTIGESTVC